MLRLYVLAFLSLFIIGKTNAQDDVPSLLGDEPPVSATTPKNEEASEKNTVKTEEVTSPAAEEKKEENVLFNFLGIKIPDFIPTSIKKPLPKIESNENSLQILTQKAENGDLQSQLKLGFAYLYGSDKLAVDYTKAFHFYQLAAEQNDLTGLNNLGTLYYNGLGTSRDTMKAAELFTKSAKLGNDEAATNLAFMYISGNGIEKDIATGIKYFQQAADDNILAKFMIGCALYHGTFIPRDYIKAAPMIKAAADAGLDEAQILLADIYIKGQGYPQNYANAVKYLNYAVTQGNVQAMLRLADIYSGIIKYPSDIVIAHTLYNLAYVRGIQNAQSRINQLQAKMSIDQLMQAQQEASNYQEKPSQLTSYVHQTFGNELCSLLQ